MEEKKFLKSLEKFEGKDIDHNLMNELIIHGNLG